MTWSGLPKSTERLVSSAVRFAMAPLRPSSAMRLLLPKSTQRLDREYSQTAHVAADAVEAQHQVGWLGPNLGADMGGRGAQALAKGPGRPARAGLGARQGVGSCPTAPQASPSEEAARRGAAFGSSPPCLPMADFFTVTQLP